MGHQARQIRGATLLALVSFVFASTSVGAPVSTSENFALMQAAVATSAEQSQSIGYVANSQLGMITGESTLTSSGYVAKPGVISFGRLHIIFSDRFEG